MQAAIFTSDDRRGAEARADVAAAGARRLREDITAIQTMCEEDPRVLGKGRAAVAAIVAEGEAITGEFERLSASFQAMASAMKARGHCTAADYACIGETAVAIDRLSEAARRLRLRAEGPRLRLV